ncbi:MAG: hypothetical protein ACRC2R_22075 [Xenococcaceae cyanobacterium]
MSTIIGTVDNDTLRGAPEPDLIVGTNKSNSAGGNDLLIGGDGNDTLSGALYTPINIQDRNRQISTRRLGDKSSLDTLTGGANIDRFVLGGAVFGNEQASVVFYDEAGDSDYALITDFKANEDIIELGGSKNDYRLTGSLTEGSPAGVGLYRQDELIAIIQGDTDLNINAKYFEGSV